MSARNRRFLLRSVYVLLVGLCSLQLLAQTPTAEAMQPATANDAASSPRLLANSNVKLGIGDLIEISVFGVPDLSTKIRIGGSGDVYLPLIAYVHVEGLTTDEAQALIQKRLEDGGFVRSPHVSIFVDESASQAITVLGEVIRPGAYPAIGERRLFDMIFVSRAGIVYVVGEVNHPSGFLIEDNSLSVLKALALAGGSTRTSALSKTRILRQTPSGVQEIPVNLKKVLYAKAPDLPLVKGDILFIPGSAAKSAAYRTADAAMSLSTSVAIVALDHYRWIARIDYQGSQTG